MLDGDSVSWGIDARLTLSFAPDGTQVAGETSKLFQTMDSVKPLSPFSEGTAVSQLGLPWQSAIVRAFQTWARYTNSDIGVVPDDGSDFGVPGLMRRDVRFGDIRVGSIPLDNELYAVAIPADEIVDGTWVGDVLFNSNYEFRNVDEIFAVTLHEAGHVFGLPHNDDPHSPMFTHGIPGSDARTPTAGDLAALESIYGPRPEDVYDARNEPPPIEIPAFRLENGPAGSAPSVVFADLTTSADLITPADLDEYRIEVPDSYSYPNASLTFQLVTAGISSLAATLTVLPETGNSPLGTAATSWKSNAWVELYSVAPGDKFRIQVAATSSNFDIGGYTLLVTYNQENQVDPESISDLVSYPIRQLDVEDLRDYFANGLQLLANQDGGSDDLEGDEFELPSAPGFAENMRYWIEASIETVGDVDRYAIQSPGMTPASGDRARLDFRSLDGVNFSGDVRVFDSERDLVPVEYLVRNDHLTVLQFGPTQFDSEYFLEVVAADGSVLPTGNYRLEASFGMPQIDRTVFIEDSLPTSGAIDRQTLIVRRPQLFHFELDATNNLALDAELTLTIGDHTGQILQVLSTAIGDVRTAAVFLPAGNFRVSIGATSATGPTGPLFYNLRGRSIDNPLGPRINDPTTTPFTFDIDHKLLLSSIIFGV